MSLNTLEELFVHELHELHSAEKQLVNALPKMAHASLSHRLQRRFEGRLKQSHHHVNRLEQILQQLERPTRSIASDVPDRTVDVLMPLGEWVPVESSQSPSRPHCVSLDDERIAVDSVTTCDAMKGLLEQSKKMIHEDAESHVKDVALIAEAQRVEHFEIAGYGTARAHAQLLGHIEAEQLLEQTLDEIKETDETLTEIAEKEINAVALQTG